MGTFFIFISYAFEDIINTVNFYVCHIPNKITHSIFAFSLKLSIFMKNIPGK